MGTHNPPVLDQIRNRIRRLGYSYRTEKTCMQWIRRIIPFHGRRRPREMGADEVGVYLTHLAVKREVSASTQNRALTAILFLYCRVLGIELPWLENIVRSIHPNRLLTSRLASTAAGRSA